MIYTRKKSIFNLVVALVIMISLIAPVKVGAITDQVAQPYASAYLDNYGAYVYLAGNGLVQVYFNVEGTGYLDEIGVLSIQIYECSTKSSNIDDWEWKTTFTHDSTNGMLSYNDDYHSGHVDYQGVDGKYYKAYICVWGGKNGDGDTRYFWTSAKP